MEHNLAVLIDFENIAAGTEKEGLGRFDVEALMQRVKDKGRILVARSYADWGRFSRFKQSLLSSNVTMMELTSHGMQDKNRADIAMVVDALELAFTRGYIDTFVVVSGDSDFTPMVLKMRELNKRVIGCGTRKSSSRLLVQACDEFVFYDSIVRPKKKARRAKPTEGEPMSLEGAYDLLEEVIEGLQRENPDPPLASVVKTTMLRKSPDFSESELGFSSFARFLEAGQKTGVVRIIRDQKSGGYRVDTLDESGKEARPEAPPSETARWEDPYLPEGSEEIVDVLSEAGIPPIAGPTRMAILQALEEVVKERKQRRRKVNIQFVREDMRKHLRRTHPDLPAGTLRQLLEALMKAGQLIHRDGTAIRSAGAAFTINKSAEQLNQALMNLSLAELKDAGVDLSQPDLLAQLFLGNAERKREVEEAIAWLGATQKGEGDEADLNEVDLDDLLVFDGTEEAEEEEEAEAPTADTEAFLEEPATEVEAAEPAHEAGQAADTAEVAEEEAPKKRPRRRRTRKKKDEETAAPEEEASDLDALLEPGK